MTDITIANTTPERADEVSRVACLAYDVPPEECNSANQIADGDDIRAILKIFAEGQFMALLEDRVVGMASTMIVSRPPSEHPLTWMDAIGDIRIKNHDPNGEWLYGVEVTVHPDYRKRGIGTALYHARFNLVKRLNLRGWYAGGMLMGYHRYADQMSIREYGEKVIRGEIIDPTVTMQMNRGFKALQVIEDYLEEEPAGNGAVLIVWENPEYGH